MKHKGLFAPYAANALANDGVSINSVGVQISRGNASSNLLLTFWQRSAVDLGTGLDFGRGDVLVAFTHLNHAPFTYNINVTSATRKPATCRIFLTPKFDERGVALSFADQRRFVVEMDKFMVNCECRLNVV